MRSVWVFLLGFIACSLVGFTNAQTIRLSKIIDNNLFQTSTGALVSMAGIDAPSINHPVNSVREIAQHAVKFSKSVLLNRELSYIPLEFHDNIRDVILIKKHLFNSTNFNILFLSKGFGKVSTRDSFLVLDEFIKEEEYARHFKKGIWALDTVLTNGEFKREYTADEIAEFGKYTTDIDILFPPVPTVFDVILEGAAGVVIGTLTSFPAGLLAGQLSGATGLGALGYVLIGMYAGYLVGSSAGIYALSKKFNPDITYFETIGYGALGALGGFGLIYALPKENIGWESYILPLLFAAPITAELIYVNDIDYDRIENLQSNKIYSHKDYYNNTIVFRQTVLRINF